METIDTVSCCVSGYNGSLYPYPSEMFFNTARGGVLIIVLNSLLIE